MDTPQQYVPEKLRRPIIARSLSGWQCLGQALASGNGTYDKEGFRPRHDRVGQRGVRRLMGQVLLAGKEPHERPAFLRDVVPDCPAQHRKAGLECIENRALRCLTPEVERHLTVDLRQYP